MKKEIKDILVVGGGAIGWLTAAALKKRHNNLNITLVESNKVPILGVGESTIPPLKNLFDWLEIDENEWLKNCHGLHKHGNLFTGWNTETPMPHVSHHWNANKKHKKFYSFAYTTRSNTLRKSYLDGITQKDYYYDNDGKFGIDCKEHDYWLELVQRGEFQPEDTDEYTQDFYHPAMQNKSARYNDNFPVVGHQYSYAWHVDAERFPKMIRDMVALPEGVKWIEGHIVDIRKDEQGYVENLLLEDGRELEADLFLDCSGFNRILMKTMDVNWKAVYQLPTQSAWVAPVKYKDPYKEMKPYTQSYAQKSGWNFIITLYSRMGSGYIFDGNIEDPDVAREDFIKYWDGYEFIRDPRLIQWDQGYYDSAWQNNVVGVGMAQGFMDPMEANSIFVAQSCIQLIDAALNKYHGRVIPEITKKSYSKEIQRIQNQISDFIAFHFGMSKRRDTPFWKKWGAYGELDDQVSRNWNEYRRSNNYLGRNLFIDIQYADQQLYLDRWDKNLCKLNIDESLLPLAKIDYEYRNKKGKAIAELAPHVYDWSKENLHNGATHEEVLQKALAER